MSDPQEPEIRPRRLPNLPIEVAPLRARQFRPPKSLHAPAIAISTLHAGQLLSGMGTWMQIIEQGWFAHQLSQSELILGIVGFSSAVPALIITPWAGAAVDSIRGAN
ncbi:MAG: hypothetical protein R2856_08930 [Caldilineaceae bacterium]